MAEVVLESVSRIFPGGVVAVDRVDLAVRDREFLVLVGPSGCGKSTTLRMIAGLEDLSSGTIRIGQRVVNDVPPKDRDIAMVFQNYALYPHMTVYKNMAFGLELRYGGTWLRRALGRLKLSGVTGGDGAAEFAAARYRIADQVREAARTLGIENLLERMPRQLSGGERQRVALGRAIVRRPAAFLFDEPLSNLDAKLRVEMRRELKLLHGRLSATMIYVTHDQVEALTLGERIAVMDGGVIQQLGTPSEVYDEPKNLFVAGFIGSAPMNFVEGDWDAAAGSFRRGHWELRAAESRRQQLSGWPAGPVVLGVRPEDVKLAADAQNSSALQARISVIEPIGDATLVTLECQAGSPISSVSKTGSFNVISKIGPRADVRVGQAISVSFDPARIHLFDPATGRNMTAAAHVTL